MKASMRRMSSTDEKRLFGECNPWGSTRLDGANCLFRAENALSHLLGGFFR